MRLKQRYMAYKTAESNFNKRKVALHREYEKQMHISLTKNDLQLFKGLCLDLVSDLGEECYLTIYSIRDQYDISRVNIINKLIY